MTKPTIIYRTRTLNIPNIKKNVAKHLGGKMNRKIFEGNKRQYQKKHTTDKNKFKGSVFSN